MLNLHQPYSKGSYRMYFSILRTAIIQYALRAVGLMEILVSNLYEKRSKTRHPCHTQG